MVAKITIGSSLFGAIKYNADKVNIGKGQLLDTNKVFNIELTVTVVEHLVSVQ